MLIQTERADRIFVVLATSIFVLSLLAIAWDFVRVQKMAFSFNLINILGLVLFFIGVIMRLVGKRTLGKYYSYGLRVLPDHRLIKYGLYKYIRHPITLAAIIYDTGIPLIFSSLYGFLLMLLLIPCFLYRIELEESMLIERFGNEYREYIRQTKKLIPFLY